MVCAWNASQRWCCVGIDGTHRRAFIIGYPMSHPTLCMLSMRALIFGASWIILGRRIWIFPNILAKEATMGELFRFWPKKDEEEKPKLTARFFYAFVAVLAILLLRHHAPDEAARARYQRRVSNIIDDVLEWDPRLALSGMVDSMQPEVNGTETSDNVTDGRSGLDSSEFTYNPNNPNRYQHTTDRGKESLHHHA